MIPTTGDMVSLWVPSGTGRAIDLIRGNHGQCYGTHPNVPVLPSLINPSLGWHFDGTNDYVDCGNDSSLAVTQFTLGFWLYRKVDAGTWERCIAKSDAVSGDYFLQVDLNDKAQVGFREIGGVIKLLASINVIPLQEWTYEVGTFDGTYMKIYLNTDLENTSVDLSAFTVRTSNRSLWLGRLVDNYNFNGYIAFPFIANKAWSQQQINNFYLATRSLFSPRG